MSEEVAYQPWKLVVTADSLQIGLLMVSFLESEGIAARMTNEHSSRYQFVGTGVAMYGAPIEVHADQVERAAMLIAERRSGNFRISDAALQYLPASLQEIQASVDRNAKTGPALAGGGYFYKIAAGLAFLGFIFGLGNWLNAHENTPRGTLDKAVVTTLASAGALIGLGVSYRISRRRKGH